jgi:hypothetical protein
LPDVHAYKDLYAHCDHMPGAPRQLRVGGVVTMRTLGWKASLQPLPRSGGINPFYLHLTLVLSRDGDVGGDQVEDVEIERYVIDDPTMEYTDVELHLAAGSEDPAPPLIEVIHTQ